MADQQYQLTEKNTLDASIIICTLNRASALEKTLLSLSKMEGTLDIKYEIIIVDNGSSDNTKSIADAWPDRLPLFYVYEARPGLSWARNRGIAESRGSYVMFTDDDCIVAANWLMTGVHLLSDSPRRIIGGRVDLYDLTDRPITIKTEDEPSSLASTSELLGFIHGCNMIFGRCVLDEIGQFDCLLGAGTRCKAAEDSDFTYRALLCGIPVQYVPELRMSHNHGRKQISEEESLLNGYLISVGAIALKYMLLGDPSLLKLAYWNVSSASRGEKRHLMSRYLAGALRYGISLLERGLRRDRVRKESRLAT